MSYLYKRLSLTSIFPVVFVVAFQLNASITVLENTPQRFSFSWQLDGVDTNSVPDGSGSRMVSLGFSGSDVALGEYGEAVLPGKTVILGVPAEGAVSATVSSVQTRTIRLAYPVATWRDKASEGRQEEVAWPARWISTPDYSLYRAQRVARFLLKPVVYDPAAKTVTVLSRATVTITFPASAANRRAAAVRGSDYEAMLKSLLMNYESALGFRSAASLGKRASAPSYPLPPSVKQYTFKVGDGHTGLNEAMTDEDGIMKLPGKRITTLFGAVSMAAVRLYGAEKGMLPDTLPTDGTIINGVSEIPLLRVDVNKNGMVDDNDYFLAFVTGASGWVYDTSEQKYKFNLDMYDDYRTYWITASGNGKTATPLVVPDGTEDTVATTFTEYDQYRQSRTRHEGNLGDRKWLWKILSTRTKTFEQEITLPGLVTGDSSLVELRGDPRGGRFGVSFDNEELCSDCMLFGGYSFKASGSGTLQFEYTGEPTNLTGAIELAYFNVLYPREIALGDEPLSLKILPPEELLGKIVTFRMDVGTSQKIYLFRTNADGSSLVFIDTVVASEGKPYEWTDSVEVGSRYVVCNESALLDLPEVEQPGMSSGGGSNLVSDLRRSSNTTDFLIISPPEFLAAADSLARHKKHVKFSQPKVVNVDDIYRYFSGGDKDVAAIRNFIGYVNRYWSGGDRLDYVILMGLGHYDTKNYVSSARDFIPVYIHSTDLMEDFFTCVGTHPSWGTPKPVMAIGRLPCGSSEQAWNIVKKIVQMEDPAVADKSEWRNRMLFVADDDMQGSETDAVASSTPHHESSDRTVTVVDTLWPSVDIRKVYLYEYPWDLSWQKPGASRALINEINNGVGYVNFFGHGADITWTDEYILTPDLVTAMNNTKRYPVISAFSCSVGKFDLPGKECLSGILARAADVGSIASISSTREAYATANENLAKNFYRFLFDSTESQSIGMAMIAAYRVISGDGYRTYCILGDPSVRAVSPTHHISLAIDGSKKNDTLAAMQKIVISGTVEKTAGSTDGSFGGTGAYVSIGFFNAPDSASRKDGGTDQTVRYILPGTPVFMGKVPVTAGKFSQTVLLPQNLTFNKPGVKLTAYAWKDGTKLAATGSRRDILFKGTIPPDAIKDTKGPRITVRPTYDSERLSGGSASFSDHVTVQMPVTCEVELFDESGIDASGIGPDEGVTLEIKGVYARRNVNSKFQFTEGDYRSGIVSVVYEEDALKPGTYEMVVTARDLIGNLSKSQFTLEVTDWDELKFDQVLNFPNPMRMGSETRFYCNSSYTSLQYYQSSINIRLTIKIYTLGGRLLRVIKDARNGEKWDGRDEQGNLLPPDIYLYQFMGEDYRQKKTVKSKIMKLVILPPK